MNKLLLLSPIILAACVQHQDPCVVHKLNNCDPALEVCTCEVSNHSGRDPSVREPVVVPDDDGDLDNGGNSGGSDDSNGGGSSVGSNDNNGSSSDSNGDNSHE